MLLLLAGCFWLSEADKQAWLDLYGVQNDTGTTIDTEDTSDAEDTGDTEETGDTGDTGDTEEPVVLEPILIPIGEHSFQIMPVLAGSFDMGCTVGDNNCDDDEKPVHEVSLTGDFYLMESEVTQGLYETVMGSNPSHFTACGLDCPVETVSWLDAVIFANTLSAEHNLDPCYEIDGEEVSWANQDCRGWRLPTEAQWEYAARGGVVAEIHSGSNVLGDVGWYLDNSGETTHPVCEKQRNGFALCDMTGNVWEWVWDRYDADYYASSESVDPLGPSDTSSASRVRRGGGWNNDVIYPRVSNRMWSDPALYAENIAGFRLAINGNPLSSILVDAGENSFLIKLIPAGSFNMGCTVGDEDCDVSEEPAHEVTISKDFYLMEAEVSQGLYEDLMGSNPSSFLDCGLACPVEKVSWFEAINFANTLSAEHNLDPCYEVNGDEVSWTDQNCNGWRLPTEAEWEYAARGGSSTNIYAGSGSIDELGWYDANAENSTHPSCEKNRNGYGLCDMSGNVGEWTWDWYAGDAYSTTGQTDPLGPSEGTKRVKRGGNWRKTDWGVRVSVRGSALPEYAVSGDVGFRLLRSP